jgi:hypothetical protein
MLSYLGFKVYWFLRRAGYRRRWAYKAARIAQHEGAVRIISETDLTPGPRQGKVAVTPPPYHRE